MTRTSFVRLIARPRTVIPVVAALACAFAQPVSAQEPPGPTIAINQLDGTNYPAINAIVTVIDARGVPAAGLTAAEFQAFDGTTQLTVTTAAPAQDATLGLSVVLTIDVSGSMAGALPDAQAAAIAFVQSLGPNDQASLITFSDAVTPVVGFTADKQQLTDAIAALSAEGGTALFEAVQTSAYIAGLSQTPRTAIVILSDGENDTAESDATAASALEAASGGRVPAFTVGFGAAPDETFLRDLSARTQGEYRAASSGDVGTVYASIATLLRSQYALTLQAPNAADGKRSSVTLIASVAGAPASATADYLRGTAPVAVPTIEALPTPPQPDSGSGGGTSGANIAAIVVGVIVIVGVVVLLAVVISRWSRNRRTLRAQQRVVAPNPRLAAAQGVPEARGGAALESDTTAGRLTRIGDPNAGSANGVIALTSMPVTIGSDAASKVALPVSADVAHRHAAIWVRDGKIMLRHVGGVSKSTLVAGRPVDWVTLEDGEEFTVGPHRFRAEKVAPVSDR